MEVTIREGVLDDCQEAGRICYEAFASLAARHGFPPDFASVEAATGPIKYFIQHPHIYGVVAECDGRILGSNFLDERSAIYSMGPISVDPMAQDRHVGRLLTQAVLDRAVDRRAQGVRLLQIAYHNRSLSLYAKLGFDVRGSFAAMHGRPIGLTMPGYDVRAATAADEAACNALCISVHGHDRAGELREAIDGGAAKVVERLGRITGYTAGIQYLAHSVAKTNDDLQALIGAAADFGTPGFLVPLGNTPLFRWCLGHGLHVFFVANMMTIGIYQEPKGAYLPSVGY